MNLDKLFEVVEKKTEEGIEKLEVTEIGTEEYDTLIKQIISNINLKHDRDILENGRQRQGQPQEPEMFEPESVIGKEFN
jgi:hypothetical protein